MLRELHTELGIPADYGRDGTRPAYEEASDLVEVGPNLVGRMQRLTPRAAQAWQDMQAAAEAEQAEPGEAAAGGSARCFCAATAAQWLAAGTLGASATFQMWWAGSQTRK